MPRAPSRGRDKYFRTGDNLHARGVMLPDPCFIVAEPVEQLQKHQISLDCERRVFIRLMERSNEGAEA